MEEKNYDKTSVQSIYEYGLKLLGHSLRELHPNATLYSGKGGLGTSVEVYHYDYLPNSESRPDFLEAGVELKCTPLKLLKDRSMASKERLVLNVINYIVEANNSFEGSTFWNKNKLLLLMFYLHESGVDPLDMLFKLIRLWKFPEEDLKIIKDDWTKIHSMILEGKADELNEGVTFYLAPCMKGTKAGAQLKQQPFSEKPAQQRAYSLKSGYVNKILLESYLDENLRQQLHLSLKRVEALQKKYSAESVVKSIKAYQHGETFEQLIERKMKPYYGKTVSEIVKTFGVNLNLSSKDFSYQVCTAILGVKSKRILEFENAGITLKTIAIEANRDYIKESMSFPYIRFVDIVAQEWEDSDWYGMLTSKFFFVVFRKAANNKKNTMTLEKVFFWNMPNKDLKVAEHLWSDTKQKVLDGDYDSFITTKTHPVCHVRPHGTKGQTVATPQGTRVQPKCFWLNNDYILNVVKTKLKLKSEK